MPAHSLHELPPPDEAALAHSQSLLARIKEEISACGGVMDFRRYMELALYAPGLGYYSAGQQRLGEGGDFTTAPEISPLFSRCLARQCAEVLERIGGDVLEFGAGSGVMAAEVLLELERLGVAPERYAIVELSADLRERQRATLEARAPHLAGRVQWLDRLEGNDFKGVVLANELLDAMPVSCFAIRAGQVMERCVGSTDAGLGWVERKAGETLNAVIEALDLQLPDGYCSELNPGLAPWMRALGAFVERAAVVLIDYGYPRREYYAAQRSMGTLICHYRHRAHDDVFWYPGLQDITANVDFTAVAEAGEAAGLDLLGYTTQAHFLMSSGLDELFQEALGEDALAQLSLAQQVKTLTLPGQMGERFQVMALGKGIEGPLRGFALRDLRNRL